MVEFKRPENSSRFIEIDFIRAIAIVLMVFTHLAIYFYDFDNSVINWFADVGGYICFSLFLFDSGVTIPISINHHSVDFEKNRLIKRGLVFLGVYLLIGILFGGPGEFLDILLLRSMPIFADFIFGLAIFFFLGAILTRFIKRENMLILISTSVIMMFIGFNLYFSTDEGFFLPWKSILFGHEGLHRFPLMQYSLVYMAGIAYGIYREELTLKKNVMISALLSIVTIVAQVQWGFDRWQASPAFILMGITTAFWMITAWQVISSYEFRLKQRTIAQIIRLSKAAAGILVVHLLLIFILQLAFAVTFSAWLLVPLSILVVTLSMLLGEKIKI